MPVEIRPISQEEFDEFSAVLLRAFHEVPLPGQTETQRQLFNFARSLAAFDQGRIVATAGAMTCDLTIPGGATVPTWGITSVTVHPAYRRQGLLTRMMRKQHEDARAQGIPLTVLTASESLIYGRFGFGVATTRVTAEIERDHAQLRNDIRPSGRVRLINHEAALEMLPAVYVRSRAGQPGALSRNAAWWRGFLFHPQAAEGEGPRQYAVYENDSGQIDGALTYRVASHWENAIPQSTLTISDAPMVTNDARAALWRYALGLDLIKTVRMYHRPVDDPLRWMLVDPRRLNARPLDDLWLRLLDIPAALGARAYSGTGRLVFAVSDPFLSGVGGTFALECAEDGARCEASPDAPVDISLGVTELAAAYLGGVRFSTLALAGRVAEHTPGALRRADLLFHSDPAPWSGTPF